MATVKQVEELLDAMIERQKRFDKAMDDRDVAEMGTVYLEEIVQHMYVLSDLVEDEKYRAQIIEAALTTKVAVDCYKEVRPL